MTLSFGTLWLIFLAITGNDTFEIYFRDLIDLLLLEDLAWLLPGLPLLSLLFFRIAFTGL